MTSETQVPSAPELKLSEILPRLDPNREINLRTEEFAELLLYLVSVENTQRELFKALAKIYTEARPRDVSDLQKIVNEGKKSDRIFQLLLRKLAESAVDDVRQ